MGKPQYSGHHERAREILLRGNPLCADGCGRRATVADHDPPIALHPVHHVPGSGCCRYRAQCIDCSRRQGGRIAALLLARRTDPAPTEFVEPAPSPGPMDPCWDPLPWITPLRDVPDTATWPRFMTWPHPNAVASMIDDFEDFVKWRTGRRLWWFQRLVAARVLEVDDHGRLVWMSWFLTMARQLGKSFLVGNLCVFVLQRCATLWPDIRADILYTSRTLLSAESLVRGLLRWARETGDPWSASFVNGNKSVTWHDHSLLIRSIDGVYGETAGLVVVDEAWDIKQASIDESVEPSTMATGGTMGYTSTAHRRAESTCLRLRQTGLATLEAPDDLLVVEWSAAPWRELDDEEGWRESSPNWSEQRYRRLSSMLDRARTGVSVDPTEPDPLAAFETQGLNRWPAQSVARNRTEVLIPPATWRACAGRSIVTAGAGWCAMEDNRDAGAAVAFAAVDADGVFEIDGVSVDSWAEALRWARKFMEAAPGSRFAVGASLTGAVPSGFPGRNTMKTAGSRETRFGLSLLRSLVNENRIVHEHTPELDDQIVVARVRADATGLALLPGSRSDLLRAALWALWFAQKPPGTPAVH